MMQVAIGADSGFALAAPMPQVLMCSLTTDALDGLSEHTQAGIRRHRPVGESFGPNAFVASMLHAKGHCAQCSNDEVV